MNIIPGCIFMGTRDAAQALMLARQAFYYLNYLPSLHGSLFSRSDGERCSWSTCLYMYHAERCPDLTEEEGVAQRSPSHIQAHVAVKQSWDPDFSGEAGEKGPHPWDMLLSWGGMVATGKRRGKMARPCYLSTPRHFLPAQLFLVSMATKATCIARLISKKSIDFFSCSAPS